jgi:hypothetical protein
MLAFNGDSHVEWFEGNVAAYEEDKKRRLGIDSVVPHRLNISSFRGEEGSAGRATPSPMRGPYSDPCVECKIA